MRTAEEKYLVRVVEIVHRKVAINRLRRSRGRNRSAQGASAECDLADDVHIVEKSQARGESHCGIVGRESTRACKAESRDVHGPWRGSLFFDGQHLVVAGIVFRE